MLRKRSEFDCQVAPFDLRERNAVRAASLFEHYDAVFDPRDAAGERRLAVERVSRHQFRHPSLKPPVIGFVPQRTIEPRRRDLEGVLLAECGLSELFLLYVEQRAQVLTDALALLDADRLLGPLRNTAVRTIDD